MTQRLCRRRYLPPSHPLPPTLSRQGIKEALQDHAQVMRNIKVGRATHKRTVGYSTSLNAAGTHLAVVDYIRGQGQAISIFECSSMLCVTHFGRFQGSVDLSVTWAEQGTGGLLSLCHDSNSVDLYIGDLVHIPEALRRSPLNALQHISFPECRRPAYKSSWPSPDLSKLLIEGAALPAHSFPCLSISQMLALTQHNFCIQRCSWC